MPGLIFGVAMLRHGMLIRWAGVFTILSATGSLIGFAGVLVENATLGATVTVASGLAMLALILLGLGLRRA